MFDASCSATMRSSSSARCAAPLRLAAGEGVVRRVVGVRQVIHAGQQAAEDLAVGDDAADRDAAEADAVIAALAADQPRARALAASAVVGERDLQRGIDRLGAGVGEEDVVEVARHGRSGAPPARTPRDGPSGRSARNPARPTCRWIASTILGRQWPALTHQRPAAPSRIFRPSGRVVHALGRHEHARRRLELPIAVNGIQKASRLFG